jgi:hypothetical protein
VSDASSPSGPADQPRHHRPHAPHLSAIHREGERVTPLELFFDLVFVLAITECTTLMSHHPTWSGLAQGLLVLGVLWWAWASYAWLTSAIDPEAGAVRLVFFAAMAAMLIAAISVPDAFGDLALVFALSIGIFRVAHIALFTIASADNPGLRRSTIGLGVSTAIAVTILVVASAFDGIPQAALWVLALVLDFGGPYVFGEEGWQLVPGHFAERHGLIVIIALGESIVEIGTGAAGHLDFGIGVAAVLGVGVAAFPYNVVKKKADDRTAAVEQELPDFAELLIMLLESGLSPLPALTFTAARFHGPVAQEVLNLRTTINSHSMPEAEAFQLAGARLGTPEAASFFTALAQAYIDGVRVMDNIKRQAAALRQSAHQKRREQMKKLPQKVVFIMALHLLPLLFIVALVPTFFALTKI